MSNSKKEKKGSKIKLVFGRMSWLYAAMHTRKRFNKEKYEEALELATYALEKAEECFGPEHLNANRSLYNLAVVNCKLGNFEEAENAAKRALDITSANWGENHIKVIDDLRNLIGIYEAWGERPEELEKVQERLDRITSGDCDVTEK